MDEDEKALMIGLIFAVIAPPLAVIYFLLLGAVNICQKPKK